MARLPLQFSRRNLQAGQSYRPGRGALGPVGDAARIEGAGVGNLVRGTQQGLQIVDKELDRQAREKAARKMLDVAPALAAAEEEVERSGAADGGDWLKQFDLSAYNILSSAKEELSGRALRHFEASADRLAAQRKTAVAGRAIGQKYRHQVGQDMEKLNNIEQAVRLDPTQFEEMSEQVTTFLDVSREKPGSAVSEDVVKQARVQLTNALTEGLLSEGPPGARQLLQEIEGPRFNAYSDEQRLQAKGKALRMLAGEESKMRAVVMDRHRNKMRAWGDGNYTEPQSAREIANAFLAPEQAQAVVESVENDAAFPAGLLETPEGRQVREMIIEQEAAVATYMEVHGGQGKLAWNEQTLDQLQTTLARNDEMIGQYAEASNDEVGTNVAQAMQNDMEAALRSEVRMRQDDPVAHTHKRLPGTDQLEATFLGNFMQMLTEGHMMEAEDVAALAEQSNNSLGQQLAILARDRVEHYGPMSDMPPLTQRATLRLQEAWNGLATAEQQVHFMQQLSRASGPHVGQIMPAIFSERDYGVPLVAAAMGLSTGSRRLLQAHNRYAENKEQLQKTKQLTTIQDALADAVAPYRKATIWQNQLGSAAIEQSVLEFAADRVVYGGEEPDDAIQTAVEQTIGTIEEPAGSLLVPKALPASVFNGSIAAAERMQSGEGDYRSYTEALIDEVAKYNWPQEYQADPGAVRDMVILPVRSEDGMQVSFIVDDGSGTPIYAHDGSILSVPFADFANTNRPPVQSEVDPRGPMGPEEITQLATEAATMNTSATDANVDRWRQVIDRAARRQDLTEGRVILFGDQIIGGGDAGSD